MIKNQKQLTSSVFSNKWKFLLQILTLFIIILPMSIVQLCLYPKVVQSEALFYIDGGLGNFQIKAKNDQFRSESENSRRHVSLGIDLEKDRYPMRFKFQGTFFSTDEKSEEWISHTTGSLHNIRLDAHGVTLDALAYYTPYTYSPAEDMFHLKPFIGGGLVYKRFKLDRKGLNGSMIPLTSNDQYYFGNQSILAIGAMPHMGLFLEIPKFDVECSLSLGWQFLAVKSNSNYYVSFSGGNEIRYPFHIYTSGSSIVTDIQIMKNWESFTVGLGFLWEKTQIDDKNTYFYTDVSGDVYLPLPELEITETFGFISFKYLF